MKDIPSRKILFNSIFVSLMRVVITLFTSSYAGYIFAKYHFKGKNLAFGVILIQIMIPFQVVMIPNYLLVVKLGLIDSLWALIIPAFIDAYGIFMMKQFIEAMPSELMDAARIDGASEFGIYSASSSRKWDLRSPPSASSPSCPPGTIISGPSSSSPRQKNAPFHYLVVWFQTAHVSNQGTHPRRIHPDSPAHLHRLHLPATLDRGSSNLIGIQITCEDAS
jgi:hypothetical protein